MHGLDTGKDLGNRAEGFEDEHGPDDALDRAVLADGALQGGACRCQIASVGEQEIQRMTFFIHCAVQVFPLSVDLGMGFIQRPVGANWPLVATEGRSENRQYLRV